MGLKKRSLSLVGRGKPCTERYRDQELVACGSERHTKKGLGFFGHVARQVSGWCEGEAVNKKRPTRSKKSGSKLPRPYPIHSPALQRHHFKPPAIAFKRLALRGQMPGYGHEQASEGVVVPRFFIGQLFVNI
jgi:hypothetical protein